MASATLDFRIGLGSTHRFALCNWLLSWAAIAGLYAFVRASDNVVIYIGETDSFASRMAGHEMWPLAQLFGATDVYAMRFDGTDAARRALEKNLISTYNPICNTQHRTTGLGIAGFGSFGSYGSGILG